MVSQLYLLSFMYVKCFHKCNIGGILLWDNKAYIQSCTACLILCNAVFLRCSMQTQQKVPHLKRCACVSFSGLFFELFLSWCLGKLWNNSKVKMSHDAFFLLNPLKNHKNPHVLLFHFSITSFQCTHSHSEYHSIRRMKYKNACSSEYLSDSYLNGNTLVVYITCLLTLITTVVPFYLFNRRCTAYLLSLVMHITE